MNPLRRLLALPTNEARGAVFTPAEIVQQPETWRGTWNIFRRHKPELQRFLRAAREGNFTIFLIGAGTSDYIGHAIAPLIRQHWQCEVAVTASTDLLTNRDELLLSGRKYLWISFSRSGDSPEGVAVREQSFANPNILHLIISCNAAGRMVQIAAEHPGAYAVVLDDAVNDRSLAMTSSFTNMVIFGQALASLWEADPLESLLDPMATAAEYLLDAGAELAHSLASTHFQRSCFIGTSALAAAARESALKVLELTSGRVASFSESTLGLRHGPMSALDPHTVLTSYVSTEARRSRYNTDLIDQITRKNSVQTLVAVGHPGTSAHHSLFCDAFTQIPDSYRPPVDVIFGQLLGLFASIACGNQPDSPSPAGVISRVVESFPIY